MVSERCALVRQRKPSSGKHVFFFFFIDDKVFLERFPRMIACVVFEMNLLLQVHFMLTAAKSTSSATFRSRVTTPMLVEVRGNLKTLFQ